MIFRSLVCLILVGCATTGQPQYKKAEVASKVWPDATETYDAIICAITEYYGPQTAREAVEIGKTVYSSEKLCAMGYNELVRPETHTIVICSEARTAWSSALRHAFFEHIVVWLSPKSDWNMNHAPEYLELNKTLTAIAAKCRDRIRASDVGWEHGVVTK